MLAQEYFEQIRETVNEIERSKEMLAAMMAKEGVGAISYEPHTSGGAVDAIDTINKMCIRDSGWSDSKNVQPFYRAFKSWMDEKTFGTEIVRGAYPLQPIAALAC